MTWGRWRTWSSTWLKSRCSFESLPSPMVCTASQISAAMITSGKRAFRKVSELIELLGDLGLLADQVAQRLKVRQLVRRRHEAEPLLPPVRDPDVAVAGSRELLAHFLQRRLRVREIPDQNADDAQPGRGSFAISALTSRSTSASSCPKSSRYECSAAWITRRSASESSIVCILVRPPWLVASAACADRDHRHAFRPGDRDSCRLRVEAHDGAAADRDVFAFDAIDPGAGDDDVDLFLL